MTGGSQGRTVRYFDLFAGAGGFRLAAENYFRRAAGSARCLGWSEIDRYCQDIYRANFDVSGECFIPDIQEVTRPNGKIDHTRSVSARIDDRIPDFDILFAGFPCQSFSLMGNGKGLDDPRGALFHDIWAILKAKQPETFVLENVRGLLHVDGGNTFATIMQTLRDDLGYQTEAWLLDSADYGVPQTRRRIFIVGVRGARSNAVDLEEPPEKWPAARYRSQCVHGLLEQEVDERYWLSDRLLKTVLKNGTGGFSYKSEIDLDIARPLCRTMHKMHRAHQDNYYSERYIFGWNNGKRGKVRRLTPLEAFRLQGFPDVFVERARAAGLSDTRLYMAAGNAVTVSTVEGVLERLYPSLG